MQEISRRDALRNLILSCAGLIAAPVQGHLIESASATRISLNAANEKLVKAYMTELMDRMVESDTDRSIIRTAIDRMSIEDTICRDFRSNSTTIMGNPSTLDLDSMLANLKTSDLASSVSSVSQRSRESLARRFIIDDSEVDRLISSESSRPGTANSDLDNRLKRALTKQGLHQAGLNDEEVYEVLAKLDTSDAWSRFDSISIKAGGKIFSLKDFWSNKANRFMVWYGVVIIIIGLIVQPDATLMLIGVFGAVLIVALLLVGAAYGLSELTG